MKNVLVLLMISFVAATSNADLTWVDSGQNDISEVYVDVGSTVAVYLRSDILYTAYDPVWVGENYSAGDAALITDITEVDNNAGDNAEAIQTSYAGWWTVAAGDLSDPFPILPAGIHWRVEISGLAQGEVVLNSDYYSGAGANDLLSVYAIPEPMTIALLGLGGLFLRRRKTIRTNPNPHEPEPNMTV